MPLTMDAYSKEIADRAVSETIEAEHCTWALRMELERADDTKELIRLSGRGW